MRESSPSPSTLVILVRSCSDFVVDLPFAKPPVRSGADAQLTRYAADLVRLLSGCAKLAERVQVRWHGRLSSAAGHARMTQWTILLNPRLPDFPNELDRTLRHELAHLVAYARLSWPRRRLAPHGAEWREACAELGIPDEARCHTLPLPRRQMVKRHAYRCPQCLEIIRRVRAIPRRRILACRACCQQYAGGRFDMRFRLAPVSETAS